MSLRTPAPTLANGTKTNLNEKREGTDRKNQFFLALFGQSDDKPMKGLRSALFAFNMKRDGLARAYSKREEKIMKLKESFITHITQEESLLVPVGGSAFSGVVRGNKTLGAILELLKNDIDEAGIVAALREKFDAPAGAVEADVARAIQELRRIGALEE